MLGIENLAVKVSDIRSVGAAGFSGNTMMVPLVLANSKLKEVLDANQLLLKENGKLGKEVTALRVENESLKKNKDGIS
jgi:hypothetical protein